MPHRSSEYIDYCTECDEKAAVPCLRCFRLYCDTHTPAQDKRCSYCEEEYSLDLIEKGYIDYQGKKTVLRMGQLTFSAMTTGFLMFPIIVLFVELFGETDMGGDDDSGLLLFLGPGVIAFWISTQVFKIIQACKDKYKEQQIKHVRHEFLTEKFSKQLKD